MQSYRPDHFFPTVIHFINMLLGKLPGEEKPVLIFKYSRQLV